MKIKIISQVKPHIWVKGGQYKQEEMPETPIVKKCGGQVKVLPLEEGFSVSDMVEKIIRENPLKVNREGSFAK